MRLRGIDVAGGLAVLGLLALVVLTLWPQSSSTTVTVEPGSGDSKLGPPRATATPPATATPSPTETLTPPEPSAEPSPTKVEESESADLPSEQRANVRVQVVNGGAPDGAAGAATAALEEQSFQPLVPENAVEGVAGTLVLYAPESRLAAETVAEIVGAQPADAVTEGAQNPNWATFGADLDVLVVIGSPLP